jgi:hypothetical protein
LSMGYSLAGVGLMLDAGKWMEFDMLSGNLN